MDAGYYFGDSYGRAYWEVSKEDWEDSFLPKELRDHIDKTLLDRKLNETLAYYQKIQAAIK